MKKFSINKTEPALREKSNNCLDGQAPFGRAHSDYIFSKIAKSVTQLLSSNNEDLYWLEKTS